jgi:hypothetical protein
MSAIASKFCIQGKLVKALCLTLSLVGLASCKPSPEAGGGIGGTGSVTSVASGPVTKLNSVFVSGTEYDNSNTVYCMDGEPCSSENNLKLGMVVLIKGTAQSTPDGAVARAANTIVFEETIEGVVQAVASDGSSVIVLGQVITLNQKTVIDPSISGQSILSLKPGLDVIEVSGFVAGEGHILATLIMRQTGTPHYEVQGLIKNHDVEMQRFEIGQLIVDYSSANTTNLPETGTTNWDGRLVHVRGNQWQPLSNVPHGASLTATRVKPLGLMVEDSTDAKIEGFITNVSAPGIFTLHNHPIEISATTSFRGGTSHDLALGTHVFIHGALVGQVLEAHEIVFKENFHLESNVESIDLQSRTVTLVGLHGLVVETDAQTVIEVDGAHASFENIRIGDHLKVHARLLAGQRVKASELERTSPSSLIALEAPLQFAADPQLILAGITVDTRDIPDDQFIGPFGVIGRIAFFQNVGLGWPVWAKGILSESFPTWGTVGMRGQSP